MAQLIKLESGQYLNLDQMLYTTTFDDGSKGAILTHGIIELSERDLEQIDKMAKGLDPPMTLDEKNEYWDARDW